MFIFARYWAAVMLFHLFCIPHTAGCETFHDNFVKYHGGGSLARRTQTDIFCVTLEVCWQDSRDLVSRANVNPAYLWLMTSSHYLWLTFLTTSLLQRPRPLWVNYYCWVLLLPDAEYLQLPKSLRNLRRSWLLVKRNPLHGECIWFDLYRR